MQEKWTSSSNELNVDVLKVLLFGLRIINKFMNELVFERCKTGLCQINFI